MSAEAAVLALPAPDSPPPRARRSSKSSLGDAESSLGDAKSSLGDAESSLGDAENSLSDAKSSLGDANRDGLPAPVRDHSP